jgi:hypothetical protein
MNIDLHPNNHGCLHTMVISKISTTQRDSIMDHWPDQWTTDMHRKDTYSMQCHPQNVDQVINEIQALL